MLCKTRFETEAKRNMYNGRVQSCSARLGFHIHVQKRKDIMCYSPTNKPETPKRPKNRDIKKERKRDQNDEPVCCED